MHRLWVAGRLPDYEPTWADLTLMANGFDGT